MEGNTVESQVEPKHYFAALIAIVMVVAVATLSKRTPPTAPVDVELDYITILMIIKSSISLYISM